MNKYILFFLLSTIIYSQQNISETTEVYCDFFKMIYEASQKNLPMSKDAANPKFRDACVNNNTLAKKITASINNNPQTQAQKLYQMAISTIYALIWTYPNGLKKSIDYKAAKGNTSIRGTWQKKEYFLEFINNICNAYNFLNEDITDDLYQKMEVMVNNNWNIVNQRSNIAQGKYLNKYITDIFVNLLQVMIDEIKTFFPQSQNQEIIVIQTTLQLFCEMDIQEMYPFVHARWQLEVQLIAYAGFYMLRAKQ